MSQDRFHYGAALLSGVVHVAVVLGLALCDLERPASSRGRWLISPAPEPESDQPAEFEADVRLTSITRFSDEHTALSEAVDDRLAAANDQAVIAALAVDVVADAPLEPIDPAPLPESSAATLEQAATIDGVPMPRSGGHVVAERGVGGVIDRLTAEIAKHAASHETTVLWLLDASLSLSGQRAEIARRLDKVVAEVARDPSLNPVTHAVHGFGRSLQTITKAPTRDPRKLAADVAAITLDDSGVENTFAAIRSLVTRHAAAGGSRTMLLVFTDEVGDDQQLVDQVAEVARRSAATIYVVGSPAPFGRGACQFTFVDPDPRFDQRQRFFEVEQGPETLVRLTLNLEILPVDRMPIDSGFGPYALTRLCHETGGLFFAVHPDRRVARTLGIDEISPMASNIRHFFDGAVMRPYRPDYGPQGALRRDIQANPAKAALVQVCGQPPLEILLPEREEFGFRTPEELQPQLSEAQKYVAKMLFTVDQLHAALDAPPVRKAAAELEDEPRWHASYLLALGRVLATKTRLDCWNQMLAEAKQGLKAEDPRTNVWIIEPSAEIRSTNAAIRKRADQARQCLSELIDRHPETPWALVAQAELDVPLAYAWRERYDPPPPPPSPTPTTNRPRPTRPPRDDVPRRLEFRPPRAVTKI